MFSSSFTMSEQEHQQWTPYKHGAPPPDPCRLPCRMFGLNQNRVVILPGCEPHRCGSTLRLFFSNQKEAYEIGSGERLLVAL